MVQASEVDKSDIQYTRTETNTSSILAFYSPHFAKSELQ